MNIIEIGKSYKIIYDDKGYKPVEKIGKVISIQGTLFKLDSKNEALNTQYIIRVIPLG